MGPMPVHIRLFLTLPLALITLLVLSNGPAYAEWVEIAKTDQGMTTYVNPDTIRRKGDLVKMWSLLDFRTVRTSAGSSYLSSNAQYQFDCAEERVRMLAVTWFSGNMGNGKVVWSNSDEQKWEPVAPESIDQAMWKRACGKE